MSNRPPPPPPPLRLRASEPQSRARTLRSTMERCSEDESQHGEVGSDCGSSLQRFTSGHDDVDGASRGLLKMLKHKTARGGQKMV